ncbi:MAG: cytochrome c oxidase assembly protein [Deltaproteobacteria bacterium]|nr:cytochrome c oxidase assembly protein [Deltaproteobacteria bacterium]
MMARILTAWDPDVSVLLGCMALLAGCWAMHRKQPKRAGWFVAGVGIVLIALTSPLDRLGDEYLFSAHMLQHLLLVLGMPPLVLLGLTPHFARRILGCRPVGSIEQVLGNPFVAWLVGTGLLTLWHVPALFDAALNHEYVHILEHLCLMVSATIFWWPILAPLPECRLAPIAMQPYLLAGAIANSLLGVWLTFAPGQLYAAYLHPHDSLNILATLRSGWGLTPAVDQQIGGLLMWVGGSFVFVTVMAVEVIRWLGSVDEENLTTAWLNRTDNHAPKDTRNELARITTV